MATSRVTPVDTFFTAILALGITAPDGSVTVPESVPPATWACAPLTKNMLSAHNENAKTLAATFSLNALRNIITSLNRENTRVGLTEAEGRLSFQFRLRYFTGAVELVGPWAVDMTGGMVSCLEAHVNYCAELCVWPCASFPASKQGSLSLPDIAASISLQCCNNGSAPVLLSPAWNTARASLRPAGCARYLPP